ncbi:hypothetical protein [Cryptosporangium arvum]|uniref:FHA domain-containing protein n=1 Tax=Cryptosporangium arvum DSM 44712 TaxID=927661 RepID=A0A010YQ72_9ACTN|nr:hypothetical protein [Cryptosporangium arvum]EXG82335.1 hypothetical protein CryarDRAFT_3508 [Cryptosporangium arvum DSM 44712]
MGHPVTVHHERRLYPVTHGEELIFGRGRNCQIRLAHEPEDTRVSRTAGSFSLLPDSVLIRNLSTSRELYLVAAQTPDRVLEPHSATTSLPHLTFDLVVVGNHGRTYPLRVDASRLTATPAVRRPSRAQAGEKLTAPGADDLNLTPARRRLLAALCRPLLDGKDDPATYREIAVRLGLNAGHVRNSLREVREMLAGAGVPGMVVAAADASPDLRIALARWAIRNGVAADSELVVREDRHGV